MCKKILLNLLLILFSYGSYSQNAVKDGGDDIDISKAKEFESTVLEHLENSHGEILSSIRDSGDVSDDVAKKLEKAINVFKKGFKA